MVASGHVTLDGVMQAPGRADEDTRGGLEHGGWAVAGDVATDPDIGAAMGARMAENDALLLGRHTYEDLLRSWNEQGGPFKDELNDTTKYVASTTSTGRLPWPRDPRPGQRTVARERSGRRAPPSRSNLPAVPTEEPSPMYRQECSAGSTGVVGEAP